MATLFTDIYKLYGTLTDDSDIKIKYTRDFAYEVLSNRLNFAIGKFIDYCYKDLSDITPFQRISYQFIGDGNTKDFILNPAPPIDASYYVEIDGTENIAFTFNNTTNTITTSIIAGIGQDIYIGAYTLNSQFNDTLNQTEVGILVDGMIIAFENEKLDKTLLMNYMVYSTDMKGSSQGNHIKEMKDTIKMKLDALDLRIGKYREIQNPNRKNLSGRYPKIII